MINKLVMPFLIFCIFLSGCDDDDKELTYGEYIIKAKNQLNEIIIKDGINKSEATIIFEIYGFRFFHYNGWGKIESNGNNWEGTVLSHWGDEPLKHKVIINKKTGATSWGSGAGAGPSIKNYKELLDVCPNYNLGKKC